MSTDEGSNEEVYIVNIAFDGTTETVGSIYKVNSANSVNDTLP